MNIAWQVSKKGIDLDGYWIEASRYNEIADYIGPWCSDWIVHMAGKSPRSRLGNFENFLAAFNAGFAAAKMTPTFDWDRSVAYAREHER